jgi:hypothetical protein
LISPFLHDPVTANGKQGVIKISAHASSVRLLTASGSRNAAGEQKDLEKRQAACQN